MKKLSGYAGVSLLAHLLLILALVDVSFAPRDDLSAYDIYEIDIVTSVPSAGKAAVSSGNAPSRKSSSTKYYYQKGSDPSTISGIKKEKALKDDAPELSPADLEPLVEQRKESEEDMYSAEAGDRQSPDTGGAAPGRLSRGPGESSNLVAVWKTRTRLVVDSVWKTPPEISVVDESLKTTYLLRISRSGELLDKRLLISSGNGPFDRSVHLALSSVTKLPQPPLVLIAGQDSVEVTMSFTPPKGAR